MTQEAQKIHFLITVWWKPCVSIDITLRNTGTRVQNMFSLVLAYFIISPIVRNIIGLLFLVKLMLVIKKEIRLIFATVGPVRRIKLTKFI